MPEPASAGGARARGWPTSDGDLQAKDYAVVKVRQVVAVLESNGSVLDRTKGSHRHFEGVVGGKRRLVTVAGEDGDEVRKGTLASIKRQSGLSKALFR